MIFVLFYTKNLTKYVKITKQQNKMLWDMKNCNIKQILHPPPLHKKLGKSDNNNF